MFIVVHYFGNEAFVECSEFLRNVVLTSLVGVIVVEGVAGVVQRSQGARVQSFLNARVLLEQSAFKEVI